MAHRNESWNKWETSFLQTRDLISTHFILQHTASHCNTLQHTATHCNILRHTASHYIWMGRSSVPWLISMFHDSFLCAMTKRSTYNEIKYQRSSVPWLISVFHDSFLRAMTKRSTHNEIKYQRSNLRDQISRIKSQSLKCQSFLNVSQISLKYLTRESRERLWHFSWWVLQHCTGFARLVWGRLRVHRAFVYSD